MPTELKIPPTHLNIARNLMPQIQSTDVAEFLDELRHEGIKIIKTKLPVVGLKLAQNQFNKEKVLAMMQKDLSKSKPLIVSKDHFVIDGNHRFLAELNRNAKSKIDAIVINLNVMDLIQRARMFDKVFYKTIHEDTVKTLKKIIRESVK